MRRLRPAPVKPKKLAFSLSRIVFFTSVNLPYVNFVERLQFRRYQAKHMTDNKFDKFTKEQVQ